jgi:hypothetical protein
MRPTDDINKLIKKLRLKASARLDKRVHDGISKALAESEKKESAVTQSSIWRTIMKSPFTKLAAAVCIVTMVVVLSLSFLGESATPAYGIEQTIKANHSVRYIHIKHFDSEHEDDPVECWVKCGEFGQIESTRIHLPQWSSPGNGVQEVLWKQNKLQIWLKQKNVLFVCSDSAVAENMLSMLEKSDPRRAVQNLYERQRRNEINVKIDEHSDKAEPIVITATCLPESATPDRRMLFFVDRATRLVICTELYRLRDGKYEYESRKEYYDYNRPIPDDMFSLDDEIPDDVILVDQTTREVGLAQGQLSEDEVAVEVVRRLFEALIAKDYVQAGKLLNGIPADIIEQNYGQLNVLRILSIGPAAPHPEIGTQGRVVPCIVELEKDGETSQWKFDRIGVRQVYDQPGRWTICDGLGNYKKVLFLDR